MKIIILGAGQVGANLATSLVAENNDITIVDVNNERLALLQDRFDLRTVRGHAAHPSVLKQAGADDELEREEGWNFGQRFMDGGEADGERVSGEQHPEVIDTEGVGEIFGLAGEGKAEGLQAFFGNRAGDHGVGITLFEHGDCLIECGHGGGGRAGVGLARCARAAIAEHDEFKAFRQGSGGEGLVDDFGADPGGITQGDGDAWHDGSIDGCRQAAKSGS